MYTRQTNHFIICMHAFKVDSGRRPALGYSTPPLYTVKMFIYLSGFPQIYSE